MLKLNREKVYDKIYACWVGKNIGGTLGTPFEGKREINDCTGFTSEPGNPLPNDDLDLQLIWLKAMREVGPQNLNSRILGTYWLEYITPWWNEYGISKANMKNGLMPPVSGGYDNYWKHSNGAWIRTEVWATLFPGDVEMAVKFAFEDASVDHGMGDGTYAAVFVAAMESAAFVIDDPRELIKIGLSNIPEDCRFAKYINTAVECYDSGMTWKESREKIAKMSLDDPELGWFQAPGNVAYAVIGLLYGDGDFKKSLLIACNCGDDTDCTCATLGSLLGIMKGQEIIPDDWREYIGDAIITNCINIPSANSTQRSLKIPQTCTEFSEDIIDTLPMTLTTRPVKLVDGDNETDDEVIAKFYGDKLDLSKKSEYFLAYESVLAKYVVDFDSEPTVSPFAEKKIKLTIKNKRSAQKNFICNWILPEGWSVSGKQTVFLRDSHYGEPVSSEFVLTVGEKTEPKNRVILEITCDGQQEIMLIPILFIG